MFDKKAFLTIVFVLAVFGFPAGGAFALDYSGSQGNPATFETLEETRTSSPSAVARLETNNAKVFKSHPVLEGYPKGTTYIYRSANLFGGRAAARLNTNILLFTETSFESKDAALAYLKSLDLIRIIDEAIGSVVLVTPSNPKSGFTADDQKYYYALQTAMLAQKASEKSGNATTHYSDAEYFGGYGYTYVIGINGGATFLNNFVAGTFDYVSRIAGMLLINGKMENVRNVATLVPVYLVNGPESVIAKYKKANDVDAYRNEGGIEIYFNQEFPLKRVVVAREPGKPDAARFIRDAYYNMFTKAMRVPVLKQGLYSASTPYQGYNFDEAPYSLCRRNAVMNGVTRDGIHLIRKTSEMFSDMRSKDGEYLQTWFEYLPREVLQGTVPAGTVPLILAMHGGGDDPRVFVDEIGLLDLAGSERFAMVAPEHQYLNFARTNDPAIQGLLCNILPGFVKYILKMYPALDASRVYVTGYSMGGAATLKAIHGDPFVFAAAVPMAAAGYTGTAEQAARLKKAHLPIMFTTSSFDLPGAFDQTSGNIAVSYQTQLNLFLAYNGMQGIDTFDFAAYPVNGFKADRAERIRLNNEYDNYAWYLNNGDGVPMVALNYTEHLIHALYPEYARIAWDFIKHYSRDQKTGVIRYNPHIR